MSRISAEELRRAILEVVQPLYRGRFSSKDSDFATLVDIPQFDDWDQFKDTTPFGLSVHPSDEVLAYYLNLGGAGLAPIIIAHQDLKRPLPDKGGSILYSTTAIGDKIQARALLKPDGELDLESLADSAVKARFKMLPTGDIELESVDGAIKILITAAGKILLGSASSAEPLVLGTAFTTLYNAHTHIGNLGVPTGVPMVPMDATQISAKSFTEI